MKTYGLHVESGPMKRTTMVHVPALTGCIARGATTDEALANTPDAIRAFLRFLVRHGERVDPDAPFRTRAAQHVTEGQWLGNGSAFLETDLQPLTRRDIARDMRRLGWVHDGLRALTSARTARRLNVSPAKGRPIAAILQHLTGEGSYLRGVKGSSRISGQAERGEVDPLGARDQLFELESVRVREMTDGELAEVRSHWSARYALRRMVEHAWEHYVEIAARLGAAP